MKHLELNKKQSIVAIIVMAILILLFSFWPAWAQEPEQQATVLPDDVKSSACYVLDTVKDIGKETRKLLKARCDVEIAHAKGDEPSTSCGGFWGWWNCPVPVTVVPVSGYRTFYPIRRSNGYGRNGAGVYRPSGGTNGGRAYGGNGNNGAGVSRGVAIPRSTSYGGNTAGAHSGNTAFQSGTSGSGTNGNGSSGNTAFLPGTSGSGGSTSFQPGTSGSGGNTAFLPGNSGSGGSTSFQPGTSGLGKNTPFHPGTSGYGGNFFRR